MDFIFIFAESINFLTADGIKFAHPLHHLGKGVGDLPIIAIDSFRHMYLFPDIKDMESPGKLKAFLQDLYSGKLHREFHYGPETPNDGSKKVSFIEMSSQTQGSGLFHWYEIFTESDSA